METLVRAVGGTTEAVDVPLTRHRQQLRTWAGNGTGATCNGCGSSIQEQEIEYEIELPPGTDAPTLHFHLDCYKTWTGRGV